MLNVKNLEVSQKKSFGHGVCILRSRSKCDLLVQGTCFGTATKPKSVIDQTGIFLLLETFCCQRLFPADKLRKDMKNGAFSEGKW